MGWVVLAGMGLGWGEGNAGRVGAWGVAASSAWARASSSWAARALACLMSVISAGSKYAGEWRGGSFGLFVS